MCLFVGWDPAYSQSIAGMGSNDEMDMMESWLDKMPGVEFLVTNNCQSCFFLGMIILPVGVLRERKMERVSGFWFASALPDVYFLDTAALQRNNKKRLKKNRVVTRELKNSRSSWKDRAKLSSCPSPQSRAAEKPTVTPCYLIGLESCRCFFFFVCVVGGTFQVHGPQPTWRAAMEPSVHWRLQWK